MQRRLRLYIMKVGILFVSRLTRVSARSIDTIPQSAAQTALLCMGVVSQIKDLDNTSPLPKGAYNIMKGE